MTGLPVSGSPFGERLARCLLVLMLISSTAAAVELPSRRFDEYCWLEFAKYVPSRVNTVILPVGTIEPHGVCANNADNVVPEKLAEMIAPGVNALVAPTISYGMTTTMADYPGSFGITEGAFEAYCREVLAGLARAGFRNIVVLNGHGPNRAALDRCAAAVSHETRVRVLVVDWWSYCSDVTQQVFGQDGGHAGINETAAVLAANEKLVKKELYSPDMATPYDRAYTAVPFPSSIGLYKEGEGYPDFDLKKAKDYLDRVAEKVARLVSTTIEKWNAGKL